jgi:hypothetical protein
MGMDKNWNTDGKSVRVQTNLSSIDDLATQNNVSFVNDEHLPDPVWIDTDCFND